MFSFRCVIISGIAKLVPLGRHLSINLVINFIYYRIAGNFRGTKFSMITSFQLFANKFSRYIQALSPIYYLKTILRFLFLRIGQNPRKPRNFCPSKISSYTVAYRLCSNIIHSYSRWTSAHYTTGYYRHNPSWFATHDLIVDLRKGIFLICHTLIHASDFAILSVI